MPASLASALLTHPPQVVSPPVMRQSWPANCAGVLGCSEFAKVTDRFVGAVGACRRSALLGASNLI